MRSHLKFLGIVGLALGLALATALPALASSGQSARLASLHADARSQRGLSSLTIASDLSRDAQQHAQQMAARGEIYHSGRTSDLDGWSALGENVGYAGSVDEVFGLFMDSPSHRNNILDRGWDSIGLGVASGDDGSIYASVLFGTRARPRPARAPAKPKPATRRPKAPSGERVTIVASPSPAPSGRTNPVPAPAAPKPAEKPAAPKPAPAAPASRPDASRAVGVLLGVEREHEPVPEPEEASAIGGVSADAARSRFEESEAQRRRRAEQSEQGAAARTLGYSARCPWRDC